jgi:glycosyltransferase involved in cell wall biosynthesis
VPARGQWPPGASGRGLRVRVSAQNQPIALIPSPPPACGSAATAAGASAARCPLKILESMAQGTPVITSDVGDRTLILGTAGFYAAPGNAEAYATAIHALCARTTRAPRFVPDMHAYQWRTIAPRWYSAHGLDSGEVAYA